MVKFSLGATPCCGVIERTVSAEYLPGSECLQREQRELALASALLDFGYCPDCGAYLGTNAELAERIKFRAPQCEDGKLLAPARWNYEESLKIAEWSCTRKRHTRRIVLA